MPNTIEAKIKFSVDTSALEQASKEIVKLEQELKTLDKQESASKSNKQPVDPGIAQKRESLLAQRAEVSQKAMEHLFEETRKQQGSLSAQQKQELLTSAAATLKDKVAAQQEASNLKKSVSQTIRKEIDTAAALQKQRPGDEKTEQLLQAHRAARTGTGTTTQRDAILEESISSARGDAEKELLAHARAHGKVPLDEYLNITGKHLDKLEKGIVEEFKAAGETDTSRIQQLVARHKTSSGASAAWQAFTASPAAEEAIKAHSSDPLREQNEAARKFVTSGYPQVPGAGVNVPASVLSRLRKASDTAPTSIPQSLESFLTQHGQFDPSMTPSEAYQAAAHLGSGYLPSNKGGTGSRWNPSVPLSPPATPTGKPNATAPQLVALKQLAERAEKSYEKTLWSPDVTGYLSNQESFLNPKGLELGAVAHSRAQELLPAVKHAEAYRSQAELIGDPQALGHATEMLTHLSEETGKLVKSFHVATDANDTATKKLTNVSEKYVALEKLQEQTASKDKLEEKYKSARGLDRPEARDNLQAAVRDLKPLRTQLKNLSTDPDRAELSRTNYAEDKKHGLSRGEDAFQLYGTGQALMMAAGVGRVPYQATSGAYKSLVEQYDVDEKLRSSSRDLQAAQLAVGKQVSPYDQFKNQVGSSLYSSPLAPTAAVAGDITSNVAGPLGGMAQTLAMLKFSGMGGPMLDAGLAVAPYALAGAGGILGGLGGYAAYAAKPQEKKQGDFFQGLGDTVGNTITHAPVGLSFPLVDQIQSDVRKLLGGKGGLVGGSGSNPFSILGQTFDPSGTVKSAADSELLGKIRDLPKSQIDSLQSSLKKTNDALENYDKSDKGFFNTGTAGSNKAKKALQNQVQDLAKQTGMSVSDEVLNDPEKMRGLIQSYRQQLTPTSFLKDALKSTPELKQQVKQMSQQYGDFFQDIGRQQTELTKNFSRQNEDLSKQKTRMVEDFKTSQMKLNLSRSRTDEDYKVSSERLDTQVFRVKRDSALNLSRLTEDVSKNRLRLEQETTRATVRLEEDHSQNVTRLNEDTKKNLTRTNEDFAVTEQKLTLQASHTEEDSVRNLSRLREDSARERNQIQQDYADSKKKIDLSASRGQADLNTNFRDSFLSLMAPGLANSKAFQLQKLFRDYSRNSTRLKQDVGIERHDLEKSTSRGLEGVNRQESRGTEDITREVARAREELELSRAEAERQHARALEDIGQSYLRGNQDAEKSYTRGTEDITRQKQYGTADISQQESRGKADIARSLSDSLIDAEKARLELEKNYLRQKQDLDLEEMEMRRNYKRGMDDLTQATKRAAEDMQVAEEAMRITISRFKRDFSDSEQSFLDQVNSKIPSSNLQDLNKFTEAAGLPPPSSGGSSGGGGTSVGGSNTQPPALPQAYGGLNITAAAASYNLHPGEMVLQASTAQMLRNAGFNAEQNNTAALQNVGSEGTWGPDAGGSSGSWGPAPSGPAPSDNTYNQEPGNDFPAGNSSEDTSQPTGTATGGVPQTRSVIVPRTSGFMGTMPVNPDIHPNTGSIPVSNGSPLDSTASNDQNVNSTDSAIAIPRNTSGSSSGFQDTSWTSLDSAAQGYPPQYIYTATKHSGPLGEMTTLLYRGPDQLKAKIAAGQSMPIGDTSKSSEPTIASSGGAGYSGHANTGTGSGRDWTHGPNTSWAPNPNSLIQPLKHPWETSYVSYNQPTAGPSGAVGIGGSNPFQNIKYYGAGAPDAGWRNAPSIHNIGGMTVDPNNLSASNITAPNVSRATAMNTSDTYINPSNSIAPPTSGQAPFNVTLNYHGRTATVENIVKEEYASFTKSLDRRLHNQGY